MNGLKIPPPAVAFFYLFLGLGLDFIFPSLRIIPSPFNLLGWIILVAGIGIGAWGFMHFQKRGANINPYAEPNKMVTDGPYRFTRNPMYLGNLLMILGIAVLVGTLLPLLASVVYVVTMNNTFIFQEEKNLEKLYGQKYRDYKKQVRRWI